MNLEQISTLSQNNCSNTGATTQTSAVKQNSCKDSIPPLNLKELIAAQLSSIIKAKNSETPVASIPAKSGPKHQHISNDLRQRLVNALKKGLCTRKKAALLYGIPYATVSHIYHTYLKTGNSDRRPRHIRQSRKLNDEQFQFLIKHFSQNVTGPYKEFQAKLMDRFNIHVSSATIGRYLRKIPSINPNRIGLLRNQKLDNIQIKFLFDNLAENCAYTLRELQQMLSERFGISVSLATVNKYISDFHYSIHRTEFAVKVVVTQRRLAENNLFCQHFLSLINGKRTLIFVEETVFRVTQRKLSGRVHAKQISKFNCSAQPMRNKNVIAALMKNEMLYYRALDGVIDQQLMLVLINEIIGTLCTRGITDVVFVIDKGSSCNRQEYRELIRESGHDLFLIPAYSPRFNPVDGLFTDWPALIRSKYPSNDRELEEIMTQFVGVIGAEQCRKYWTDAVDNVRKYLSVGGK